MLPDALPQLLMDTLLRLPFLEAAQLRELIQHLPDPQAAAQEMLRRGWITQNQFLSLFPGPQERPTPRETMVLGVADDENPPNADCDWSLPLDDEEDQADVPVPVVAGGSEARRPESDTDKLPRPWLGWASKGLLMCTLFLGSFFAGRQFFWTNSTPIVPSNNAKQRDGLPDSTGQNEQPAAPVAVPPKAPVAAEAPVKAEAPAPANDAKPKAKASLYARVRQAVLENKTEETQRLGIGDVAYQHVPDDGSIMVGMEVTYAPFFNHQIIKSVRPIYQRPNGTRYDGPVCGNPTQVVERVVAKEGYAIGGAAIKSGMGIDGMQLTFMEIGADGLNPDKSYLSKWLGGYGGADARTFVNDGRPIVGIAGMRSNNPKGPAFCLCLVTTSRTGGDHGP
jgi:hypothetical protein